MVGWIITATINYTICPLIVFMVEPPKQRLYEWIRKFSKSDNYSTTTIFRYYTFMRSNNCTLNMIIYHWNCDIKVKVLTNQLPIRVHILIIILFLYWTCCGNGSDGIRIKIWYSALYKHYKSINYIINYYVIALPHTYKPRSNWISRKSAIWQRICR